MARRLLHKDGGSTRNVLVNAAVSLMRQQGFNATTVEQICTEAQVTKGAFFHYFQSKEAIGRAAIDAWCAERAATYVRDISQVEADPLHRLEAWLDGLIASVREEAACPVCLLGMLSQEVSGTNDTIRSDCQQRLNGWTGFAAGLLEEARQQYPGKNDFDPQQVAWMLNSLWQGSLLVAKTQQDVEIVASNLEHARNYIRSLFRQAT